jgi:hypothetical protein
MTTSRTPSRCFGCWKSTPSRWACICWRHAGTGAHLTDGAVPDEVVRSFKADPTDVERLCDAGLWERVEGGYVLVHHLVANRSRHQVEADREAAAERKRLSRARAARRRAEPAAHAADDGGEDDFAPF